MITLDIFKDDAFSLSSLTTAIQDLKYVPGYVSQSGLFTSKSVATLSVMFEEKNGILTMVAPSPRGGAGQTAEKPKRSMRSLSIPHFQIDDAIMADEVQGIRAFSKTSEVETVMGKVGERLSLHRQSLAATQELSRLGAVKGVVKYSDDTELDLFDFFGISQSAVTDFDLDNASPTAGALRKKCAARFRQMANILDGVPFSGISALCGDAFFDDLINNPETRESYLAQAEATELRSGYVQSGGKAFGTFYFGDILWVNYRGNSEVSVDTNESHMYPTGVPGLFETFYAPADYIETVNTMGEEIYAKQIEMRNQKGIELEVQTNALEVCTRPKALLKGKRT